MNRTVRGLIEAILIGAVLTGAIILATLTLTKDNLSLIEIAAVFLSFTSTWLCTKQIRANYVFAVGATALLSYTFWDAQLYGSMVLNLYLIPTVIYGWFIWGKDRESKPAEHVTAKALIGYAAVTVITWLGAYLAIKAAGGTMVALDGWLLVGTVLAQFLMDRKKLENWIVWGLVNTVSIYVYFENGLYLLAAQFVLFLANAIYAYFVWRKTLGQVIEEGQVAVQLAASPVEA